MFSAFAVKVGAVPNAAEVMQLYREHVEREVEYTLNYEFSLNRDLMLINDTEEEGLLFEIPDKDNIGADAKEAVLKSWLARELEVIKQLAQ
jgi:hypothetical protein